MEVNQKVKGTREGLINLQSQYSCVNHIVRECGSVRNTVKLNKDIRMRKFETSSMRQARRNRSARRAVVLEVLSYLSIPVVCYFTVVVTSRILDHLL